MEDISLERVDVAASIPVLVSTAAPGSPSAPLAISLHGFGQTPEHFLPLTRRLLGPAWTIAAPRAPHPMSLRPLEPDSPAGFHWGLPNLDRPAALRLHHDLLLAVLERLRAQPARTLLIGFSQPCALNYRFARQFPHCLGAVLALCGGVPHDWETLPLPPTPVPLLHISRSEDEFYPVDRVQEFPRRLRAAATDVEFHLLAGRHRFPSQAGAVVTPWLRRVLPAGS